MLGFRIRPEWENIIRKAVSEKVIELTDIPIRPKQEPMKIQRYKYNVINKKGKQEDWTDPFANKAEAEKWYNKWGEYHEEKGYKLILRKVKTNKK